MKFYICYKFLDNKDKKVLREKLEKISETLELCGHSSYIHWRDEQHWQINQTNDKPKEIISGAFFEIAKSDALLVLSEGDQKSEGMFLEIGYGYALKKQIIFISPPNSSLRFVKSIANIIVEFNEFDDLIKQLKDLRL